MNTKITIWILVLFVLLSSAYADCVANPEAPECQQDKFDPAEADYGNPDNVETFFSEGPFWEEVAGNDAFWLNLPDDKVGEVPAEHINSVTITQLAENWDSVDASKRGEIEGTKMDQIIASSDGTPVSLEGVSDSAVQEVIQSRAGNQITFTNADGHYLEIDRNGLLNSGVHKINIEKITGVFGLDVDKDGKITLKPGAKTESSSSDESPDENPDSQTQTNENEPTVIDMSENTEINEEFSISVPEDATEPILVKTFYGEEIYVFPGSTIEYVDNALQIVGGEEGASAQFGLSEDIVKSVTVQAQPQTTVAITSGTLSKNYVFLSNIAGEETVSIGGAGFSLTYTDKQTGDQTIQLHETAYSSLEIRNRDYVAVIANEGRITAGSWIIEPDGKAKLPANMEQLSMPSTLSIDANKKGRLFDQQYTWNAETESFDGRLIYGNQDIRFDGKTSINEILNRYAQIMSPTEGGGVEPSPDQVANFIANTKDFTVTDLQEHENANFGQFPPDKGQIAVNQQIVDGKTQATYTVVNEDNTFSTYVVPDSNGDGTITQSEIASYFASTSDQPSQNAYPDSIGLNQKLGTSNYNTIVGVVNKNKNYNPNGKSNEQIITDNLDVINAVAKEANIPPEVLTGLIRTELGKGHDLSWEDDYLPSHTSSANRAFAQALGKSTGEQSFYEEANTRELIASYAVYAAHLSSGASGISQRDSYYDDLSAQYKAAQTDEQKQLVVDKWGIMLTLSNRGKDTASSSAANAIVNAKSRESLTTYVSSTSNGAYSGLTQRQRAGRASNYFAGTTIAQGYTQSVDGYALAQQAGFAISPSTAGLAANNIGLNPQPTIDSQQQAIASTQTQTGQDLINHFYREGNYDYDEAYRLAKEENVDLDYYAQNTQTRNEIVQNYQEITTDTQYANQDVIRYWLYKAAPISARQDGSWNSNQYLSGAYELASANGVNLNNYAGADRSAIVTDFAAATGSDGTKVVQNEFGGSYVAQTDAPQSQRSVATQPTLLGRGPQGLVRINDNSGNTGYIIPEILQLKDAANKNGWNKLDMSSTYRSHSHNTKVGGARSSDHLWGGAADFFVDQNDKQSVQQGTQMVTYLKQNGANQGVDQIIYQGTSWRLNSQGKWYVSGTNMGHYDHVHVGYDEATRTKYGLVRSSGSNSNLPAGHYAGDGHVH